MRVMQINLVRNEEKHQCFKLAKAYTIPSLAIVVPTTKKLARPHKFSRPSRSTIYTVYMKRSKI